ncbi:glycosyltransferase family 2 protein [Pontibacter sp. HSC-14F20]|uniref:glycosyltransferase family 2 protein n=1 Tax=Pontibacter sp. HSC-14F20 TaxID=2864136 RepID=UPI001C73B38C|nr:glycosyltransferase family 2 protein [Pontibacter sp. HSC-14F20]MBX0331885.1 glycosyltransferase family 2 protein [Pontibacter sp. HSC-14F20]
MVNELYSEEPAKPSLTILVPVFNEAECLVRLSEALDAFLQQSPIPTQVLYVNDGSTDGSLALMREICQRRSQYHYISLSHNSGLSTAIKAGIDHCQSTYIGYIDADLQTSPLDFLLFFEHLPEHQMVCGIRMKRKDTFVKKISSRIANGFRRRMINDGIVDTGCPLKIVDAAFAKRVPFFDGMHRFLPALIQLQGGKIKQIPVQHFERYAGTSKYHLFNRLWGPLNDTFAFRWMRKRYIRYTIAEQFINKTAVRHEQV